jgi:hypothetical protein
MGTHSWRTVTLASLLVVGVLQSGASAHDYPGSDGLGGPCGKAIKWTGASQTYYHATVWNLAIQNGIENAAASITNGTDFDWTWNSLDHANTITDLNSGDTSIAGATSYTSVNCTPTPGTISAVLMYFNLPHFNTGHGTLYSATWQAYFECTMIHELGHGLGLAHNNTSPSIMNTSHTTRCHTNLWKTVQAHDVSDINAKY